MKRAHRRLHRLVWLLLVPATAAVVWLAADALSEAPENRDLPASLSSGAA